MHINHTRVTLKPKENLSSPTQIEKKNAPAPNKEVKRSKDTPNDIENIDLRITFGRIKSKAKG